MEIAIIACCPSTHACDGSEHITPQILPASTALLDCSASQTITKTIKPRAPFEHFPSPVHLLLLYRCRVQRWSCASHITHHKTHHTTLLRTQTTASCLYSSTQQKQTNKQTTPKCLSTSRPPPASTPRTRPTHTPGPPPGRDPSPSASGLPPRRPSPGALPQPPRHPARQPRPRGAPTP